MIDSQPLFSVVYFNHSERYIYQVLSFSCDANGKRKNDRKTQEAQFKESYIRLLYFEDLYHVLTFYLKLSFSYN